MNDEAVGSKPPSEAIAPIVPNWPAPANVHAYSTTRSGGVSQAPFDSLNLGLASGDDIKCVEENRARVVSGLKLPETPRWIRQVHGTRVVDGDAAARRPQADASITKGSGQVLAVLTADCVPVLICDRRGQQVAAAHAGWRGLAAGVLERVVEAFEANPSELLAWLGPGIGPRAFEVGPEVRRACLGRDSGADAAFRAGLGDRLFADLYLLARRRLGSVGVGSVFGGSHCTFDEAGLFFSYRRDGKRSGRMGTFIWLEA